MSKLYKKHKIGMYGEDKAVEYIKQIGYEIIQRNFRCKIGEIDIIAQDKDEIVFIEVKTRTNMKYGKPIEAVNKTKKKHIYKAIQYYCINEDIEHICIRIDAIEVYLKNGICKINHLKQIF